LPCFLDTGRFGAAVARAAHDGIERAAEADEAAAANAAERVEGGRIATLSRSGTVLTVLASAAPAAVLVAVSRPGGEGIEVAEAVVDETEVTLATDTAFPSELTHWEADALLVGADTVLPDGSVRNKVGTYPAAAVAAREDVPVFVVTATDKISPESGVEREPWPGESPHNGDAPLGVANPTFDVTPADCIAAILTERGALDADDVAAVADEHRALAAWDVQS
jgi:translation initiation factor 2B subunit (eIF-2B alpha/beta/delta family)